MFTDNGVKLLLTTLSGLHGVSCRFIVNGARQETLYPTDAGYPKPGDTDEANDGRGTNVLTWRFTVPKGDGRGPTPATEAELVRDGAIIYRTKLAEPFRVSQNHPSILFININLRGK